MLLLRIVVARSFSGNVAIGYVHAQLHIQLPVSRLTSCLPARARIADGKNAYTENDLLNLLAAWWPGARSARDNDFLACNFAKYSSITKNTYIFSNKSFLIWLLTTQQYIKYVATLPRNLSLIACFLTLMFYKVTWQHMQGVVRFLITSLLQIYSEIFPWVNFMNRFRFDRIMVMSLWPHILAHPVLSTLH